MAIAMAETRDPLSIRIDRRLLGSPSSPIALSIIKMDDFMNTTEEKLQDPKLVSIGPIHSRNTQLKKMEQHKLRYLKQLLQRRGEATADRYVMAIRSFEERARRCYADDANDFDANIFVEMLLLDGSFIVELLRKYSYADLRERDDPLFKYDQFLSHVVGDLMLVENQIPFFIIKQLFSMTQTEDQQDDVIFLIQHIVGRHYPFPRELQDSDDKVAAENVDHLFGLMYKSRWSPSFARMRLGIRGYRTDLDMETATDLVQSGIRFKRGEGIHFLDIKFVDENMIIPTFVVDYSTESCLRNLILYEHFFHDITHPKYVTDYVFFLNCLIRSSADVKYLRRERILTNMLADDDGVHQMLKRLQRNVAVSRDFWYADIYDSVNKYCRHPRKMWMAELRRHYFSTPLAFMSFVTAYLQLVTQTVLGILSYAEKDKPN